MWSDHVDSAPGSVSQVRAAAHELTAFAKRRGTAIVLVGHVTKDGQIAGPRVVEHMVDTVLYFEGERGHQFRILRAVKNRFGPADEIGVFEMTGQGLAEVANPSALFLSERDAATSGSAVFAGVEGTRPLLVEIQALVAPAAPGSARRTVVGWDQGRLAMLLAVLEVPLRHPLRPLGRLPQRRRRPAHHRARRRPRRRRRAGLRPPGHPPPARRRRLRRGLPLRRAAPRPAVRRPPARGRQARLHRRLDARPASRARYDLAIHPVADLAAFMDKCFGTIER